MEFKSKIKRIKDPDTSKELVISNLYADKQMIEAHRQRLVNIFKNDTPQQIDQKISNIVIRDNVFNAAMNEIVKSYEINYDEEEISNAIVKIKPQFADASDEKLKNIAQKLIAKALIFRDLADTWSITVSDQEVKESLQKFYMFSNEPIKPYLDDPIKFANVRNVLLEEKIATVILQKFKHRLDIKPTNPAPNNPDATKTATDKNKIN